MIDSQSQKVVNICPPTAIIDNTVIVSDAFDTLGFDYCTIYVTLGAMDIAMTVLKVQEADALTGANLTAGADVTGLVYGTSANIAGTTSVLPTALNDGLVFGFDIDLKSRKRYLQLLGTCGDGSLGTFVSAVALLSRAEQAPVTAAQRGCLQVLRA